MEDFEEMMLQISDVMRQANKIRPIMTHEEAVKAIRKIVTPKGKWIENDIPEDVDVPESVLSKCSVCGYQLGAHSFKFCPECGAAMIRREVIV